MSESRKNELLEYLGELMYDLETSNYYFKRIEIEGKIKLLNTLLLES